MTDDAITEKIEPDPDDSGHYHYRSIPIGGGKLPWRVKLKVIALFAAGITLGTFLFLFFLTAFLYLFLPAMILIGLWRIFNRRS